MLSLASLFSGNPQVLARIDANKAVRRSAQPVLQVSIRTIDGPDFTRPITKLVKVVGNRGAGPADSYLAIRAQGPTSSEATGEPMPI